MEVLYRIEEFNTTGWELIDEKDVQLTREACAQRVNEYYSLGLSPDRIRVVVDA